MDGLMENNSIILYNTPKFYIYLILSNILFTDNNY